MSGSSTSSKRSLRRLAASAALLALVPGVHANSGDSLFAPAGMTGYDRPGLRVELGAPVRVTSELGWQTLWPHATNEPAGTFIHLTPVMARFPRGNLIATYAMDPDAQDDPLTISGFQISRDGGAHWGRRYTVLMQHNPMIFIPVADDSLLAVPSELNPLTPGDERNFVGTSWLFQQGGASMLMVPEGVHVVDWPWPLATFSSPQPVESWQAGIRITGSVVKLGGRWLITAEVQKKGDRMNHDLLAVLLASDDAGRTWRYYSTLGEPDRALDAQTGYEGPNEPFVLALVDGTLMGVFRVGSGERWHLRRRYSSDQGRTWSNEDILPAWSVKPQLVRLANGTIALSTGRPGIYLWLATDPRATAWQKIDIVQHHNRCLADPHDQILPFAAGSRHGWQSSSYTGLVGLGANRLLLLYDRDPEVPPTDPKDVSSIFALPVAVERR